MSTVHLAAVERLTAAVRAMHDNDAEACRRALADVPAEALVPGLLVLCESAIVLAARTAHVPWEVACDTVTNILVDALEFGGEA